MQAQAHKWLIVVGGPTASGKTALAIDIAKHFNTEILSADSRQFYKELNIGVARPSKQELAEIKHHFIGHKSIREAYSAGQFASDALEKLDELYQEHNIVVMVGGSGLFVQAVTKGFHQTETHESVYRQDVEQLYQASGIEGLVARLKELDLTYAEEIDNQNPQRLMRAIERVLESGKPHKEQYTTALPLRPFKVLEIAIDHDREKLYDRINQRVDAMLAAGLVEEAKQLESHNDLNALQTVGYKELFEYFDGQCTLEEAVDKIKQNTRRYAKRQVTWMRNKTNCHWVKTTDLEQVTAWLERQMA